VNFPLILGRDFSCTVIGHVATRTFAVLRP
jgi:hypothetical protein